MIFQRNSQIAEKVSERIPKRIAKNFPRNKITVFQRPCQGGSLRNCVGETM